MVADTLKVVPAERDTTRRWSAAAWAAQRQGWLFPTSTPETRTRLVPLASLDMLVLRLMNLGQPSPRSVWFVLNELASLQRLPQLHTAITESRKSNNPSSWVSKDGASWKRGAGTMPTRCCRNRRRRSFFARVSRMQPNGSPTASPAGTPAK
jgi:hypothetical protein